MLRLRFWFSCFFCYLFCGIQSAPITKTIIDMTYVFDETTLYFPTHKKFEMVVIFNSTTDKGYWLQLEEYSSAIHVGTHMDAPCHFAKGRWTIDQVPLSRLMAPAAVVDITVKAEINRDAEVDVSDLINWEEQTGRRLDDVILLIRSGWGQRWNNRTAFTGTADTNDTRNLHFPGMSQDAATWLVENRNIYGLGTEALSLDHGQSSDFQAHRILLAENIFGLENMANMDKLPIYGATLHVMPMKIGSGSGAPARIVAIFPDIMFAAFDRSRSADS